MLIPCINYIIITIYGNYIITMKKASNTESAWERARGATAGTQWSSDDLSLILCTTMHPITIYPEITLGLQTVRSV